jgi:butyrate kinase
LKIMAFMLKQSVTEFAIFDDGVQILDEELEHSVSDLHARLTPHEQGQFRLGEMMEALVEQEVAFDNIDIVVTLAGCAGLRPGIYLASGGLVDFLKESEIDENDMRAGVYMAYAIAEYINSSYDTECIPLVVELKMDNQINEEATLSGLRGIARDPVFHVYSHHYAAAVHAWENSKSQSDVKLVVAHLGTETSVGAYDRENILDSNSPLDGEGPFSPTASGSLPVDGLVKLCFSGKYDMDEMLNMVTREGGLTAHLGSGKLSVVQESWHSGDEKTKMIVKAMAREVAREIGARAVVLRGEVETIILTGPWAAFTEFTNEIVSRVEWIANTEINIYESELSSLSTAAMETFHGNMKLLLFEDNKQ